MNSQKFSCLNKGSVRTSGKFSSYNVRPVLPNTIVSGYNQKVNSVVIYKKIKFTCIKSLASRISC